ncbi:MAG: sodium:solute symporter family protein [Saprospiraceae bacterium]|nr:sodium:solute symporter family protein [Saprospiraceae bacterium]
MLHFNLHTADYGIILLYLLFVVGVGWLVKRQIKSSNDYLTSSHSIPLWITSLAFISANLGAQEVIGMAASGAKYGVMTSHFYWVGAIPAMVFMGVMMMPFYYGSKARTVPEYLKLRFDEKTRSVNAVSFGIMTVFSSGISMYALARLLEAILGWNFDMSVILSAGIVMVYILMGGLTSAVYNEVLQFFLIVFGIAPVVFVGLHEVGGWQGIVSKLPTNMTSSWKYMGNPSENPMGVDSFSLVAGLGLAMSFGYWCTDFLVVQRAMISRNMSDSMKTPILAAIPKMFMPFIVIFPGLIAAALPYFTKNYSLPLSSDGSPDYNMALPSLIAHYYPEGLLGLGLTALLASFMSGMAGNVTAFNSIWTFDIYQAYFNKNASDNHYLYVGKVTTVVGIVISIAVAYLAKSFNNINDFLQVVFSFFNGPIFATFFMGMFWKRATGHGAFAGLLGGTLAASIVHGLTVAEGKGGWIMPLHEYGSGLSHAFNIAWIAFVANIVITVVVSLLTKPVPESELQGLVYGVTPIETDEKKEWYMRPVPLAIVVTSACIILNWLFA